MKQKIYITKNEKILKTKAPIVDALKKAYENPTYFML